MRLILTALLAAATVACTPVAQFVDPRPPVTGRADTVTVTDSRTITAILTRQGEVEAPRFLGRSHSLIVALHDGSVSDLVGSVVAVNYPQAHVDVSEFAMTLDYGMWMATGTVNITAEITPVERPPFVIRASATDNYFVPTTEYLGQTVNAALADFADKLKGASVLAQNPPIQFRDGAQRPD